MTLTRTVLAGAAALALLAPSSSAAQILGWKTEAEASASLFSTSAVAYEVNRMLSATISFLETYDSQATLRGARTNHDGQLLFGLLTTF